MSDSIISSFFDDPSFSLPGTPEDIFNIIDALDGLKEAAVAATTAACGGATAEEDNTATPRSSSSSGQFMFQELSETELDALEAELLADNNNNNNNNNDEQPKSKRAKIVISEERATGQESGDGSNNNKISHITVERNRRKQMNEHLSVLRSLMPCFYVKRGDQASIIGGVVEYINELQHILQSLEAKKQRKVYSEVLSPRVASSPRTTTQHQVLSPRKPPLSPRLNLPLPISPRTPQPSSPYRPRPITISSSMAASPPIDLSPSSSSSSLHDCSANNELVANSSSPMAEVEVKFAGPNLLLKTASTRIPGQVLKIISTLEDLSLEILHINISTIEDTMLNSFTIKIGIECQLSAEELAHHIQQTFCVTPLLNYS